MKQYTLLLFVSFLVFSTLQGQNKWTWGVQTEIGLSGEKEEANQFNTVGSIERGFGFSAKRKPAFGGGVWVNYQLLKRLGLRSGLQYMNMGDERSSNSSRRPEYSKIPTIYTASTYSLRAHRLQLPFIIEYHFARVKFEPTIGGGVLLSRDFISNIKEQSVDISNTPERANTSWHFSEETSLDKAQLRATIGMQLNDRLHIELSHLFGMYASNISWLSDGDYLDICPGGISFCGTTNRPTDKRTITKYHRMSSLVLRYTL